MRKGKGDEEEQEGDGEKGGSTHNFATVPLPTNILYYDELLLVPEQAMGY